MLIASTWRHREEMKRIGRANADRRWDVLPQQPALAYDIAQNRLIVTAAVLQAPVLDMAQDAASHYGTFGALVGHELGRSVDEKGQLVDAAGELKSLVDAGRRRRLGHAHRAAGGAVRRPTRIRASTGQGQRQPDARGKCRRPRRRRTRLGRAGRRRSRTLPKESKQAFFQGWAQLWRAADVDRRRHPQRRHRRARAGPVARQRPAGRPAGIRRCLPCKAGTPMQAKPEQQVSIWRAPAAAAAPVEAKTVIVGAAMACSLSAAHAGSERAARREPLRLKGGLPRQ